jgi:hypothetical protein
MHGDRSLRPRPRNFVLFSLRLGLMALIVVWALRGMVVYHSEGWEDKLHSANSQMERMRKGATKNKTMTAVNSSDPKSNSDGRPQEIVVVAKNTAEHPHDGEIATQQTQVSRELTPPHPHVSPSNMNKSFEIKHPEKNIKAQQQSHERESPARAISPASETTKQVHIPPVQAGIKPVTLPGAGIDFQPLVRTSLETNSKGQILLVEAATSDLTLLVHWLMHLDKVGSVLVCVCVYLCVWFLFCYVVYVTHACT